MFSLVNLFGYAHGVFWKAASTFSKLIFLFAIVPWLPDGAYAEYIFGISVTLIPALLLSFSAMDELPIRIQGNVATMNQFALSYVLLLIGSWISIGGYYLFGKYWLLLMAILLIHATQFVLVGLIRSIKPEYYEWLANIPAILFVMVCFTISYESGTMLLQIFFFVNMLVTVVLGAIAGVSHSLSFSHSPLFFRDIASIVRDGSKKSISNILMVLDTRGLIIFPKLMLNHIPSDRLAIAITAGEAVYQFAMVVVNRNFVRYCNGEGLFIGSLKAATIFMVGMGLIGCILLAAPFPFSIPKFDPYLVGWAVIFFSGLIAFMEIRQFLWARQTGMYFVIACQIAIALVQLFVVLQFAPDDWMRLVALISVVSTSVAIIVAHFWVGKHVSKQW